MYQGKPWNVDAAEFVKPGKGSAIYRLRLKNLLDGSVLDITFRSADKVDEASIMQSWRCSTSTKRATTTCS